MPDAPQTHLPDAVFMIGIGGMGMAPLAIYLAQAGVSITGWDDSIRPEVAKLLAEHDVELRNDLPDRPGLVARSSAISETHSLLTTARERGAKVMRRGELLAEVVADKQLVAIVGSHGKTTTTGLLVHLLKRVGFESGYLLGALFRDDAMAPAHFAPQSNWVVAEIDESDGTLESFSPGITVAVNFDWDHADRYATEADLRAAFSRLFERTSSQVIIPGDCQVLSDLAPTETTLRGKAAQGFNAANASMALAAAEAMGATVSSDLLSDFPGINRRQDVLAQAGGVTVLADYAHHPTEIDALLFYARSKWGGRQIAIFQPHRFTRTRHFAGNFAQSLAAADEVILMPVYAASESTLESGQSEAINAAGQCDWPIMEAAPLKRHLDQTLADDPEATVLFIGAGDIDEVAREFAADMSTITRWRESLSANCRLTLAEPLAGKTTLRVGGAARFFAEPASTDDLTQLLNFAKQSELPWFGLGRGSNLIVADQGFPGLVISLKGEAFRGFEPLADGRVKVGAGLPLKRLCGMAAKAGLGGFEFLEGIPGTVGGALRMNAGAMGGWIFDIVESVDFMTPNGEIHALGKDDFNVGYRRCAELVDALALTATFHSGSQSEGDSIRHQMDTYASKRKESQPREPSAGCIFKNPDGGHAGKLIDECGLKGKRIGGAEVSTVHGNFIINQGGATAGDVLALIREIRAEVRTLRGVDLEPEALLVGQRWEDSL